MPLFSRHKNYKLKDIEAGHFRVTYRGIPAIKCPFDYVLYQQLLWQVKPDLLIEIGTHKGGSSLYLADLLERNGKGMLHTIDLPENAESQELHRHKRIRVFKNGYQDYPVNGLEIYPVIMVIEDGSHRYEDSLAALKKFAPLVTKDSYYIVEDGIVTELGRAAEFNGGPQKAIREFLAANKQFTIDRGYCDFFGPNATFNVNGYLKRIS